MTISPPKGEILVGPTEEKNNNNIIVRTPPAINPSEMEEGMVIGRYKYQRSPIFPDKLYAVFTSSVIMHSLTI